jgi:hypothetical protein
MNRIILINYHLCGFRKKTCCYRKKTGLARHCYLKNDLANNLILTIGCYQKIGLGCIHCFLKSAKEYNFSSLNYFWKVNSFVYSALYFYYCYK